MTDAADDPAEFTVTKFGRKRRRGKWAVIVTVAMVACMGAVRAFRRALGWHSGS